MTNTDWRFTVAPMLDWTDRHCRVFHRTLSRRARLYTEMVTTGAILYGDQDKLLGFNACEHPVALQLGGSDPEALRKSVAAAEAYGYDEYNLNCGCPSERVQKGAFGASLMLDAPLVAECLAAMREATDNAFNVLAKAINSLYIVNEIVDKNEETRTELTELINNVNDVVYRFRKVIGVGNSSQGNGSNGGSADSDKPQITAVYQKENGNPDKPLDIKRGAVTVIEGNGLTLLNKEGTAAGDLIIRPNWYDNPLDEKVKPDSILVNTDTRIEFNMVPDLAEGKYTLHIETYYNGKDNSPLSEPVVIDFDKEITLI